MREQRAQLKRQREADTINRLTDELLAVDNDDIVCKEANGSISFMIGDRKDYVEIAEHVVVGRSWHCSNKGFKYKLCGKVTDYKQRYYTNPATVLNRITEAQQQHIAIAKREDVAQVLQSDARNALKQRYPHAKVELVYRPEEYRKKQPNMFKVTGDNGSVSFTYKRGEDGVVQFNVLRHNPNDNVRDTLTDLILEPSTMLILRAHDIG